MNQRNGMILGAALFCVLVACKSDGKSGAQGDTTKSAATLEQKLEKWLDKQVPKLTDVQSYEERNKEYPGILRNSDSWVLKVVPAEFESKYLGAKEHRVTVFGQIATYGREKQEIGKFIRITVKVDRKEYKDIVTAHATFSLKEIEGVLRAIDTAVKVKSQIALGSSETVRFFESQPDGLSISGYQGHTWKPDDQKGDAEPEFVLSLIIDKASVRLKSGDWMELKLKIEAAKNWLESQQGDMALLAPEKPKDDGATKK